MGVTVLIIDSDVTFKGRLLARIERDPDDLLQWRWAETLEEALRLPALDPALILVEEGIELEQVREAFSHLVLPPRLLVWRDGPPAFDTWGVNKFQSAEALRRTILHVISLSAPRVQHVPRGGKLFAFTGIDGGVGTSTIVRATARTYVRRIGGPLFYWSMDPLGRGRLFLDGTSPYTLSDLILSMRLTAGDPVMRLAACLIKDGGLATLSPPKRAEDVMEIEPDEWLRFFQLLKDTQEKILVDLPTAFFYVMPELVQALDGLFLVLRNEERGLLERWAALTKYSWEGRDRVIVREAPRGGDAIYLPFIESRPPIERRSPEDIEQELQQQPALEEVVRWMSETPNRS